MDKKTYMALFSLLAGFTASVFIIGGLFKVLHWPGGAMVLLNAAVMSFCLSMFALVGIKHFTFYTYVSKIYYALRGSLILMVTDISASVLSVGLIFKILHWPGGGIVLMTGAESLAVCAVLLGVLCHDFYKNKE